MDNSFQNFPERLGYCFHSNGFEKKRCFLACLPKEHLGLLSRQNYN